MKSRLSKMLIVCIQMQSVTAVGVSLYKDCIRHYFQSLELTNRLIQDTKSDENAATKKVLLSNSNIIVYRI